MSITLPRASRRARFFPLRQALFFVLCYLYVWLHVNPRLMYFWPRPTFPAFLWNRAFFAEFLGYPGGLVEYASAFLSQLYHYSWLGALVITIVGALLCLAARVLIGAVGRARPTAAHLIPALLVLMLYGRYAHHLTTCLALLTAMLGACVYVLAPLRGGGARLAFFLGLSAPLYWLAGGAYLLYAALCGFFELLTGRRRLLGLLYLACVGAVPYVLGTYVFRTRIADTYGRLLPFHHDTTARAAFLAFCLYLFFPLAAFWARLAKSPAPVREGAPGAAGKGRLKRLSKAVVLPVAAAALVFLSFDAGAGTALQVEYYAHHRMWARVLEEVPHLPRRHYGLLANMTVNWALYHADRLPYDMFDVWRYPQNRLGLLRGPEEFFSETAEPQPTPLEFMRASDIFLDLARVNESEHLAHEALEDLGCRPWVLERLAVVNIVKGRTEVARTFLAAMGDDLIYGHRAREWLERLDSDPMLSFDREVARLRYLRPVAEDPRRRSVEHLLQALLEQNGRNRMAFEYLMAHYLLTGRLEEIVRNIRRLDDFDYLGIPRLYEEAILIYMARTGSGVRLGGRTISEETRERFRRFAQDLERYGSDLRTARRRLAKDYGDSYFPYFRFFLHGGAAE